MKPNKSMLAELVTGSLVVIALIVLINPFDFLMTFGTEMGIITLLAMALVAFGIFVWREQPADEREAQHGLMTARLAYFAAAVVVLAGIAVQGLNGHIDPWLPGILLTMVVVKLAVGKYYSKR